MPGRILSDDEVFGAPAAPAPRVLSDDEVFGTPAPAAAPSAFEGVGQTWKSLLAPAVSTVRSLGTLANYTPQAQLLDHAHAIVSTLLGHDARATDYSDQRQAALDHVVQPVQDYLQTDNATMGRGARGVDMAAHVVGSLPTMIFAPEAFLADSAMAPAQHAIDQYGVDSKTATELGAANLLVNALGMKAPAALGKNLATRVATGAAINPAIGAAGAEAEKKIYDANGEHALADAVHPLDPESLALQALMGGAFGVSDHVSARRGDAPRSNALTPDEIAQGNAALARAPQPVSASADATPRQGEPPAPTGTTAQPAAESAPAPVAPDRMTALRAKRAAGQLTPDEAHELIDLQDQDARTARLAGTGQRLPGVQTMDAEREASTPETRKAFLDLDNFKAINDTHGHGAGDEVIATVADLLAQRFPGKVFHKGGDEFVVHGVDDAALAAGMNDVRDTLSKASIEATGADGEVRTIPGLGMSYGIGADIHEADRGLQADKQARLDAGLRTERRAPAAAGDAGHEGAGEVPARAADPLEEVSRLTQDVAAARAAGDTARVTDLTAQLHDAQERASAPQDAPTAELKVVPKAEAPAAPEPPQDAPTAPAPQDDATTLSRANRTDYREAAGHAPLPPGETVHDEDVIARARAADAAGPAALDAVLQKQARGEALTTHDKGVLLVAETRLRNAREDALARMQDASKPQAERDRAGADFAEAERHLHELHQATEAAGSESGRSLRIHRLRMARDYSIDGLERRLRDAKGSELSTDEHQWVREHADAIAQAQLRADEAEAKVRDLEAQLVYARQARELVAEGAKLPSKSANDAKWDERAAKARARIKATLGRTNAGIDPALLADLGTLGAYHIRRGAQELGRWMKAMKSELGAHWARLEPHIDDIRKAAEAIIAKEGGTRPTAADLIAGINKDAGPTSRELGQLVRAKILDGVHGADAVMKAVHADLEKAGFELTERDVRRLYTDYGKATFPSKEAVAVEAREIRRIVQLQESIDRLREGNTPLKSGPQRDKASQAVREKQAELNDLLKRAEKRAKDDPQALATYQDARRRNLQNQIDDLEKQLRTGERPARTPTPELDAANKALAARRDALAAERDAIDNPPGAARNAAEKRALQKQLDEVKAKLAGKETPAPAPEHRVDDAEQARLRHELEQAQAKLRDQRLEAAQRAAVQARVADLLQRLAGKSKPAAAAGKPDSAEVANLKRIRDELQAQLVALENPPKAPEQRYNTARAGQLRARLKQLEAKLQSGSFGPSPPAARHALTAENMKLQDRVATLKAEVDRKLYEHELAQRSVPQKLWDTFLSFRRAMILSGLHTLGKLTAAASSRALVTTPVEEAIGTVLRLVPGIHAIAAKAPREGAGSLRAEIEALRHTFSADTWRQMRDVALSGKGALDRLYGENKHPSRGLLDIVGQIHGMLKAPAKINEFHRALVKRTDFERQRLIDEGHSEADVARILASPETQAMLLGKAYADGQAAIMMGDNWLVDAYRAALGTAKHRGGRTGKVAGGVAEYMLPIVKVPTNFAGEVTSYAAGGPKAALLLAIRRGVKHLTPEEADYIMRNLKKQTVGAALMYLGYVAADAIGGYYQPGDNKKKGLREPGSAEIGGHEVPKYLLHIPAAEMLQVGATIRRVADASARKDGDAGVDDLAAGARAAAGGVVGNIPFIDAPERLTHALKNGDTFKKWLGGEVADNTIPRGASDIAELMDHGQKRQADGFVDQLKKNVPGLREDVPEPHETPHRRRGNGIVYE